MFWERTGRIGGCYSETMLGWPFCHCGVVNCLFGDFVFDWNCPKVFVVARFLGASSAQVGSCELTLVAEAIRFSGADMWLIGPQISRGFSAARINEIFPKGQMQWKFFGCERRSCRWSRVVGMCVGLANWVSRQRGIDVWWKFVRTSGFMVLVLEIYSKCCLSDNHEREHGFMLSFTATSAIN